MPLKAGTVSDFENSLAEAMEDALKAEWAAVKQIAFPTAGEEDRRLLLVAIAQGVIRYLKDNADDSLVIHSVAVTQDNDNVTVSGTTSVSGTHSHSATLTQNTGAGNRVESTGNGKLRLETTGDLH